MARKRNAIDIDFGKPSDEVLEALRTIREIEPLQEAAFNRGEPLPHKEKHREAREVLLDEQLRRLDVLKGHFGIEVDRPASDMLLALELARRCVKNFDVRPAAGAKRTVLQHEALADAIDSIAESEGCSVLEACRILKRRDRRKYQKTAENMQGDYQRYVQRLKKELRELEKMRFIIEKQADVLSKREAPKTFLNALFEAATRASMK